MYTSKASCPTCDTGVLVFDNPQCSRCTSAGVPLGPPAEPVAPAAAAPLVQQAASYGHAEVTIRALLGECELIFETMRSHHPEMPPVVVLVASGASGRGGEVLGWHAPARWQPKNGSVAYGEVMLAGEGLLLGAEELLLTLLHEGGHAIAKARGVKDTSRQGRYHSRVFAAIAAEVGLTPPAAPDRKIGFSAATLGPAARERYGRHLVALERVLTMHRLNEGARGGTEKPKPTRVKLVCGCRSISIAFGQVDLGGIDCRACGQPFVNPDTVDQVPAG